MKAYKVIVVENFEANATEKVGYEFARFDKFDDAIKYANKINTGGRCRAIAQEV